MFHRCFRSTDEVLVPQGAVLLTLRVIGHPGAFMYIVILSHFTVKQGDNVLDLKLFYVIL